MAAAHADSPPASRTHPSPRSPPLLDSAQPSFETDDDDTEPSACGLGQRYAPITSRSRALSLTRKVHTPHSGLALRAHLAEAGVGWRRTSARGWGWEWMEVGKGTGIDATEMGMEMEETTRIPRAPRTMEPEPEMLPRACACRWRWRRARSADAAWGYILMLALALIEAEVGAGEVELEVEAEREVETETEMISMRMLVSMELEKCMGAGHRRLVLDLALPPSLSSTAASLPVPPPPLRPRLARDSRPTSLPCYESRRDLPRRIRLPLCAHVDVDGMEVEEEEVERTDEMEMGTAQPGTGKTAAFILDNAQSCPIEKATSRKIMRIETNDVAEMEEKMKEALK
ncbi:hypothetical protein B0H13DRAFT_2328590 [Mycena leptocephala]|nr:hypothetical protein B0H13DRAFT_2328590 [Mycena leptocephala]